MFLWWGALTLTWCLKEHLSSVLNLRDWHCSWLRFLLSGKFHWENISPCFLSGSYGAWSWTSLVILLLSCVVFILFAACVSHFVTWIKNFFLEHLSLYCFKVFPTIFSCGSPLDSFNLRFRFQKEKVGVTPRVPWLA